MILTCPDCATSYFVDDSRIPPAGRTVKCTSCGARWTAVMETAAPAAAREPEPERVAEPALAAAMEPAPISAIAPEDDLLVTGPEPTAIRPSASPRQPEPRKDARATVFVLASMAAVAAAMVAGAIVFRGDVVRLWPKSSAAYEGLGLPVNGLGLVIEAVHAEPTFQGGRPVLSVTGAIRNVQGKAADAPAIRISLLNRAGKPVAAKIARPIDARIPAGARRHFAIAIVDPPSTARDLEVAFDTSPAKPAAAAPPRAAEAVLTPAPIEARPLPAGTPDALPNHG